MKKSIGLSSISFLCKLPDRITFLTTRRRVTLTRPSQAFPNLISDLKLAPSPRNSWRRRTLRTRWASSLIMTILFKEASNTKRKILSLLTRKAALPPMDALSSLRFSRRSLEIDKKKSNQHLLSGWSCLTKPRRREALTRKTKIKMMLNCWRTLRLILSSPTSKRKQETRLTDRCPPQPVDQRSPATPNPEGRRETDLSQPHSEATWTTNTTARPLPVQSKHLPRWEQIQISNRLISRRAQMNLITKTRSHFSTLMSTLDLTMERQESLFTRNQTQRRSPVVLSAKTDWTSTFLRTWFNSWRSNSKMPWLTYMKRKNKAMKTISDN